MRREFYCARSRRDVVGQPEDYLVEDRGGRRAYVFGGQVVNHAVRIRQRDRDGSRRFIRQQLEVCHKENDSRVRVGIVSQWWTYWSDY